MNRKLREACSAVLQDIFGADGYRPGQKAAVSALLSGRDLLCILPTGAGKSLCWQLPAVLHEGVTLVVSPLIALMQDQVRRLQERGIGAVTINSLMLPQARRAAVQAVRDGIIRIIFLSPEMLESPSMASICREAAPWLLVVDEAHCIAEWGAEFRPAYARIGDFIRRMEMRPVICAMTATADDAMQRQIVESLQMTFPKRVILPVIRENLQYRVITTVSRTQEILRLVSCAPARTVIFCRSRARTEHLAEQLRTTGIPAEFYHAGLHRNERIEVQERFRKGETMCLAATTAFGMGVDIPDIRRVIHDALPDSVTELVQQSGRAGRDGEDAECIILLSPRDLICMSGMLRAEQKRLRYRPAARLAALRKRWLPLRQLLRALLTAHCIPAAFADSFGQRAMRCGHCSACRNGPVLRRIPPLPWMNEASMQLWLLRWQCGAIAKVRGTVPGNIMTRKQLWQAVNTLTIPPMQDVAAQQAMERLMASIRPSVLYEKGVNETR